MVRANFCGIHSPSSLIRHGILLGLAAHLALAPTRADARPIEITSLGLPDARLLSDKEKQTLGLVRPVCRQPFDQHLADALSHGPIADPNFPTCLNVTEPLNTIGIRSGAKQLAIVHET